MGAEEGEEQSQQSLQGWEEVGVAEAQYHRQGEAAEEECQSFHREGEVEVVVEGRGYPWRHLAEVEGVQQVSHPGEEEEER